MKLERIHISNFLSIKELKMDFSSELYCLVGQNEAGKSNILKAISILGGNFELKKEADKKNKYTGITNSVIEGTFLFRENEYERIVGILSKYNKNTGNKYNYEDFRKFKISVNDISNSINWHSGFFLPIDENRKHELSIFPDPYKSELTDMIKDIYPKIEYYQGEEILIEPIKLSGDENALNESITFQKLLNIGGIKNITEFNNSDFNELVYRRENVTDNINRYIDQYYKPDFEVQIKIESHNDVLSLFFRDKFGHTEQYEERSTGFQFFFSFLINKIYNNKNNRTDSIYLLDEPALSLHPTNQKKFLTALQDFSKNNLIIYTTHSPFSINKLASNCVWTVERNLSSGTVINFKSSQNNWKVLRNSIGMELSDSFLYADKSLVIEGIEDRIYINAFIDLFARTKKVNLRTDLFSIIESGSAANMPAIVQIIKAENRPLLVIMDNDEKSTYNKLKKKEKDGELSVCSIAEFKDNAICIEDLLPLNLYVESIKNYLNYLLEKDIIKYKEGKEELPTLSNIEIGKRYKQIAALVTETYCESDGSELDDRVPISKFGIASEFANLLKGIQEINDEFNGMRSLIEYVRDILKL